MSLSMVAARAVTAGMLFRHASVPGCVLEVLCNKKEKRTNSPDVRQHIKYKNISTGGVGAFCIAPLAPLLLQQSLCLENCPHTELERAALRMLEAVNQKGGIELDATGQPVCVAGEPGTSVMAQGVWETWQALIAVNVQEACLLQRPQVIQENSVLACDVDDYAE